MKITKKPLFIGMSAFVLMCLQVQSAHAFTIQPPPTYMQMSYEISLNSGINQAINHIAGYRIYADGSVSGMRYIFQEPSVNGISVLNDLQGDSTTNPPVSNLLIGLVSDLPGDPVGQKHVVLMMDNAAANAAAGSAWETLFHNTSEAQLISDLESAAFMIRPYDQLNPDGALAWDTAAANLANFAYGDATNGILANGGLPLSAWFSLGNIPAQLSTQTVVSSNFTVMAWSDGQALGTGTSTMTFSTTSVPVPAAIWLFTSAIAGLGVVNFRRRS